MKHGAPDSSEEQLSKRIKTEEHPSPIVYHLRRLGAFLLILMNIFLPASYEFSGHRKKNISNELADVLGQMDKSLDKKDRLDSYEFLSSKVPKWMKCFKHSLTEEERKKDWITTEKAVEMFFKELTIVTDLLITTWTRDQFQKQFCLDRLCNLFRSMGELFGSDEIVIFREQSSVWYGGKYLEIRRVLELEGYFRPKMYSAW